ncbi:FAD dependent oxidoreductase [Colletotrichum phormii]|uniref:FAD dependent oxidoreductase n=1 Tax=Colletotrichum phormii TaxID=359342 RepID=A0AAJ0EMC1_9PEZI|nr:FAD dependent oxidoreductase [Colletotrichum phormii]KAK1654303.1 FAD dependent oxidoreductase [Colletotrichum phormii]
MTGETLQPGQADLPSAKSTASYWHREPSKTLLGHRTTRDLPPTADIVVVGSGITGAFAAKELLERAGAAGEGKRVVLLEAREVCWGATGRNGGHCQPVAYNPNTAIATFELANYAHLRDLITDNAIPCDWVSLRGVHALLTHDLVDAARKQIAALPPRFAPLARLVTDAEELARLRIPDAVGAVVQEEAASVWPYKLVAWIFEDLLRRFGVDKVGDDNASSGGTEQGVVSFNIQTSTPVTRLQHLPPTTPSSTPSWILHTPRGQIATAQVLLASNAYTSRLLPRFADLVVPVRGQVASLFPPRPRAELGRSYVFMASSDAAKGEPNQDDYLIQRPGPGLEMILGGGRARGTLRGVGFSDDDEVDAVVARYLRRAGAGNLDLISENSANNSKKELEASHEWTGIMAFSRDGRPWVGEVPAGAVLGGGEGLWVCAGYTGHGMPQAALCGRAVAGMMMLGSGGEKKEYDEEEKLPAEFLASEERAEKARALPSIKEMDDLDMFLL